MASNLFIGTQSADLPTITSAGVTPSAINVGGLLIKSDRGTSLTHKLISDIQSGTIFGRYRNNFYGRYAISGFFANLQGAPGTLYVKRAINSDALASTVNVANASANPTWQFDAGRLGLPDPGVWGQQLWVTVTASSRGNSTLSAALVGGETVIPVVSVAPFKVGDWIDIDDATNTHQAEITVIDESANTLTVAQANPALNAIAISAAVTIVDRTIKVYMKDSDTGNVSLVETISNVTVSANSADHFWETVVNDEFTGSGYIMATQLTTAEAGTFADLPAPVADAFANAVQLTGGTEGTAPVTLDYKNFLSAFDDYDVRYLSNTESFSEAIWDDGEQYCKERGDCVWVGSPTVNLTESALVLWANNRRRSRKVYAFNNHVWLRVDDPIGTGPLPLFTVPNVGHIMGYAISHTTSRGIHKVPASRNQTPVGIRSLVGDFTSRTTIRDLANIGMNTISDFGGVFSVRSARTPSLLKEHQFVNSVSMSIFFKKSFEDSFAGYENDPNQITLLDKIRAGMYAFALLFYQTSSNGGQEGGFASFVKPSGGDSTFEDVTKVVVDETNNSQTDINAGIVHANFYFMAPPPAERILIGVGLIFNQ